MHVPDILGAHNCEAVLLDMLYLQFSKWTSRLLEGSSGKELEGTPWLVKVERNFKTGQEPGQLKLSLHIQSFTQ